MGIRAIHQRLLFMNIDWSPQYCQIQNLCGKNVGTCALTPAWVSSHRRVWEHFGACGKKSHSSRTVLNVTTNQDVKEKDRQPGVLDKQLRTLSF
jgi:hypothetical protein